MIVKIINSNHENKFMKKSTYLCLLKILVKLDFKKVEYSLDDDIKNIMVMLTMSHTDFGDPIYQYNSTLIIRKMILQYDILSTSPIF